MEFITVLDAPATDSTARIQIAKLGSFEHGNYGKFQITQEQVESWRDNLAKLPGGHAPIDLDHSADRGRGTEAAGWITGIEIEDGKPMADVEWTPLGRAALSEKRYRFISPTFSEHKKDEAGQDLGDTLVGAGLTNRPHLNMPAISLSSEYDRWLDRAHSMSIEFIALADTTADTRKKAVAAGNALPDGSYPIPDIAHLKSAITLAQSGHGDVAAAKTLIKRRARELGRTDLLPESWTDSRRSMELSPQIVQAPDLGEDADEQKVLDAIQTLQNEASKPEPEPEPETKTLDELAKQEGKIVLDSAAYAELQSGAADGREARKQLQAERFEAKFKLACDEGKAVVAEEEAQRHFYNLDADATLKALEDRPQIVNTKPIGKNVPTDGLDAPAGVDAKAFQLDQAVKQYMVEKDESDYVKALHAVEENQRMAA